MPDDVGMMTNTAILTTQLTATQAHDGWYQLLPAGKFKARDGRPQDVPAWFIDGQIAHRLIEGVRLSNQDVVIDYDHQTFTRAKTGLGEALAAGRFNADEMQWRDGSGLWIKPRWTPKAAKHIQDGEYLFLSAVFHYDKQGIPTELRMAGLTNDPGVVGMQSLTQLAAEFFAPLSATPQIINQPKKESTMSLVKELLAALDITVEGDQVSDEQLQAAIEAVKTLKAAPETAALNAKEDIDLSKYVPVEVYNGLHAQYVALSATSEASQVEALINNARNDGRILESEVKYMLNFGKQQGFAKLSALLETRSPIAALSAMQTTKSATTTPTPAANPTAALSAEEQEVTRMLGINPDDFLKNKEDK